MRFSFPAEEIKSRVYLVQWMFIALVAGLVGTASVRAFTLIVRGVASILAEFPGVPAWAWPPLGALVVGLGIYSIEPHAKGEGLPSYLESLRMGSGRLPFSETFFKFWAASVTLGTGGNGGFLGPVGRVSAGIMSSIGTYLMRIGFPGEHARLFPVCGLAAAVASLIHSPVGAGIFAVEITQKANMRYRQLFPAILAGTMSTYFSRLAGFEPVINFPRSVPAFDLRIGGTVLLLTVVAGITGRGYILLYSGVSKLFRRDQYHSVWVTTLHVLLGSLAASVPLFFLGSGALGTSGPLFSAVLTGQLDSIYGNLPTAVPLVVILASLIFLKAAGNTITVGSGMSAGFASPAILVGLLLGALFATATGIPPGSPEYFAMLAAGFAGVFSSTMNTPIATAVLALETFGLHAGLPAGLAAVVGFQVNRHHTLYDLVLEEREEEHVEEVRRVIRD